jgi:hypothetical protein
VISAQLAAALATVGLLVLICFQVALAAGAPWGRAAWGGKHHGRLPRNLRIGSAVAVVIWAVVVLVILDRAGMPIINLPDEISYWATWLLVPVLVLGAIMNFASDSPYERFGWGPLAAAIALLVLVVALA